MEWIEIVHQWNTPPAPAVSTLAVEWIEITITHISKCNPIRSPPSRWSGLKFWYPPNISCAHMVSTLAVEWIEIPGVRK